MIFTTAAPLNNTTRQKLIQRLTDCIMFTVFRVVVVIMRHLISKSSGDTITACREIVFCILTGSCKDNYSDVKVTLSHYLFSQLITFSYKTGNASIMGQ